MPQCTSRTQGNLAAESKADIGRNGTKLVEVDPKIGRCSQRPSPSRRAAVAIPRAPRLGHMSPRECPSGLSPLPPEDVGAGCLHRDPCPRRGSPPTLPWTWPTPSDPFSLHALQRGSRTERCSSWACASWTTTTTASGARRAARHRARPPSVDARVRSGRARRRRCFDARPLRKSGIRSPGARSEPRPS